VEPLNHNGRFRALLSLVPQRWLTSHFASSVIPNTLKRQIYHRRVLFASMNNEEEKQVQEECVEQGFGVEEALRCGDWELLRTLSLKPGGFGKERSSVWSFLVQANTARTDEDNFEEPLHPTLRRRKQSVSTVHEQSDSDPDVVHPDEHQIKLDTDRSFVLYPVQRNNGTVLSYNRTSTPSLRRYFTNIPG